MKNGSFTGSECIYIGTEHYDFIAKDGKQVVGDSRKAVLIHFVNGTSMKIEVVKCAKDCSVNAGDCGSYPVFDRFGRFCGFR